MKNFRKTILEASFNKGSYNHSQELWKIAHYQKVMIQIFHIFFDAILFDVWRQERQRVSSTNMPHGLLVACVAAGSLDTLFLKKNSPELTTKNSQTTCIFHNLTLKVENSTLFLPNNFTFEVTILNSLEHSARRSAAALATGEAASAFCWECNDLGWPTDLDFWFRTLEFNPGPSLSLPPTMLTHL